ncbi:MAG TPA: ester cyclase [Chloroflexia bacterium]|jgi:steroid delta-isomerase-like uncharacterized protein|nr:ester cyclase [Chloroflexia bacterium]
MCEAIPPVVNDLLDAWNAHDVERALRFYSPEFDGEDVGIAQPLRGEAGVRHFIQHYLDAFPGLHITQEAALVNGDQVAVSWTAQGYHQGPLMNIPATGHVVTVRGMSFLTLHDNKIRKLVNVWDVAGMLRELGLLPEL